MFTVYTQNVKTHAWAKGRSFKKAGYAKKVAYGIIECGYNTHLTSAAQVRDDEGNRIYTCWMPVGKS
jgi:hypothetical protein